MNRLGMSGLETSLRRGWWLFLVRGLLALAVGIIAVVAPHATLAALILLLGAFFIVDGAFAAVKSFSLMRSDPAWWWLLLSGLASIGLGIAVFTWPRETALTLGYLIGVWALVTGVLEIVVAFALRSVIRGEWFYVLFGIVSVVFGAYVLFEPGLGLAYLTLMIALYGFIAGIALVVAAFRLRSTPAPPPPPV